MHLTLADAKTTQSQVAQVVLFQVFHRDVKTQNILMDKNGTGKATLHFLNLDLVSCLWPSAHLLQSM